MRFFCAACEISLHPNEVWDLSNPQCNDCCAPLEEIEEPGFNVPSYVVRVPAGEVNREGLPLPEPIYSQPGFLMRRQAGS